MSWELEPWSPPAEPNNNELASVDSEPDVIDAAWSPVATSPDYDLEPTPEPDNRRGSWGGGWMQQSEPDNSPVTYAEPDVIDAPFTWLQPEPDNAPVKRDSWGGGWFGSNSSELDTVETDSSEIERYTSAHLETEPETETAYWQPIGERDALPADTGGIPAPDWWSQTTAATSQATDVFSDVATDATSKTKSASKTGNSRRREPDALDAVANWLGLGGGKPTKPDTAQASGSSQPSAQMQSGGGGSRPDYGWYFIAQDDPREDADIHALRHWYFTYEFHDGNEEWPEKDFHAWVQSLKGADYRLYVDAGKQIMDNELVDNLKPGTLKTAYLSMRLEGDSPDAQRNDIIGRVSAAFLRGFSR